MFGYNPLAVIERDGLVGIIVDWEDGKARIMLEAGKNEVAFVLYSISAVSRFKVIG